MKKRILAGFILLSIPALIFGNDSFSFFYKNKNYEYRDTIPNVIKNSENLSSVDTFPDYISSPKTIMSSAKDQAEKYSDRKDSKSKNNKAEKIYNNLGYLSSTDEFLKNKDKENLSKEDKEKLAHSYRLNGMTEDAEYWYSQVVDNDASAENMMYYAEMLQSNGKCEDATRWYQAYATQTDDKNRTFIEDCDALQSIPNIDGVSVENIEELNTSALDFSPILYDNGLVFSSTRGTTRSTKNKDKWTNQKFSDLFFVEKSDGSFTHVNPMDDINEKFHDGTATFNKAGDYMIFTRNSKRGKSKKGVRELKLFEAHLQNGKWSDIKSLNINNDEFASCHPTLSPDGNRMYFSSSRPGGYGGMDIYLSKKISGRWTEPQNLGPIVNSSGNEVFPYLHEDEKLYFSSNGHKGVGGLDIFVAEKKESNDETSWNTRDNLGTPFNSPKDDVGFIIEEENKSGYLSSNRKGGKGRDDIYAWTFSGEAAAKAEKKGLEKSFCVYNIINKERLEGVNISILPGDFQSGNQDMALTLKPSLHNPNEFVLGVKQLQETLMPDQMTTTDENGKFNFSMLNGQGYYFVLSKKGYGTVQHQTDMEMVQKRDDYCIAMAPRSCMTMKGSVINEDYNRPVPFADIQLFNRCTGETIPARSDENGQFEFCVDCDCEFEIVANKDRFKENMIVFSTIEKSCENDALENVTVKLKVLDRADSQAIATSKNWNSGKMTAPQQHPFRNNYSTPSQHSYGNNPTEAETPITKEFLLEYFTGNPNSVISAGQTFVLKNIYYDFDKYNIRSDAGVELNYIANLMELQPTMEISLTAHTDTRGANVYNKELSQKRAQAARAFLIQRGISSHRIHGINGMGESAPVIPCVNEDCSDEEHQTNRRTEITILKI